MVPIIIDLPQQFICPADIQIQPLEKDIINQPSQDVRFCLSLLVLLIPYGYLLYHHVSSLWELHTKNIIHQLDGLDLWIVAISMLRLAALFLFPMISHNSGLVLLGILALLWEIGLLMIYLKFVIETKRNWLIVFSMTVFVYLIVAIIINYSRSKPKQYIQNYTQDTNIIIPVFFPQLIIDLAISLIAVYEFLYIQKAMAQRSLTANIIIELKNRRSFIFLTVTTCWVSLFMRKYPEIFQPLVGVVLYFLLSEWLNMAIIYRCVLHRIIRSNQESEIDEDQNLNNKRTSNLIVIEMQEHPRRK